ncbi:MAG: AarF/ABC1/UbiB kinase family protein [bacterium]|nr:AarF/ABC1/UbiB kinase family protein [bacterium]
MRFGTPQEIRDRRREVERHLVEHGLLRGPSRHLPAQRRQPAEPQELAVRLGPALAALGPVFAAFGRYLSYRADLLPMNDCLTLGEIPDQAPPLPAAEVHEHLAAELDRPHREIFSVFDDEPFESRLFHQSHRARLSSGEAVVVRVLRPPEEEEIELLGLLKRVFPSHGSAVSLAFDELLRGFRRILAARLDLAGTADALEFLGRDARRSDLLVVPQVYRDLSTPQLLTIEWLGGSAVDAIPPSTEGAEREDLARRICLIWLYQALIARRFPLEADIQELPDGRLAITGGVFATLPASSQVNLWDYLRATSAHIPDRAARYLLRELSRQGRGVSEAELRTRLRQVIPFRDGAWSAGGESLAEYAVGHWRLAREYGYRARPHLVAFYRGLFWAARTGRRFSAQGDPLAAALNDLHWLAGWNQFRQLTAPSQVAATFESYLTSLLDLPQKLAKILRLAAADEPGLRIRVADSSARRRRKNATVAVISFGLAMAALALAAPQLSVAAPAGDIWIERLSAAGFGLLGLGLLRAAWSMR